MKHLHLFNEKSIEKELQAQAEQIKSAKNVEKARKKKEECAKKKSKGSKGSCAKNENTNYGDVVYCPDCNDILVYKNGKYKCIRCHNEISRAKYVELENKLKGVGAKTNEGYYDDISGWVSTSQNNSGFKDGDKVKPKKH